MIKRLKTALFVPTEIINMRVDSFGLVFVYILLLAFIMMIPASIKVARFDKLSLDERLKIQDTFKDKEVPYTIVNNKLSNTSEVMLSDYYIDEEIMQDIVPIKLYEYLAMEKVVIATELPGISKEFGYGNGIEYVQKAEEVLETAQRILDEGRYEEISKKGREYVKSNDWEAITDKFEKALNDLFE